MIWVVNWFVRRDLETLMPRTFRSNAGVRVGRIEWCSRHDQGREDKVTDCKSQREPRLKMK